MSDSSVNGARTAPMPPIDAQSDAATRGSEDNSDAFSVHNGRRLSPASRAGAKAMNIISAIKGKLSGFSFSALNGRSRPADPLRMDAANNGRLTGTAPMAANPTRMTTTEAPVLTAHDAPAEQFPERQGPRFSHFYTGRSGDLSEMANAVDTTFLGTEKFDAVSGKDAPEATPDVAQNVGKDAPTPPRAQHKIQLDSKLLAFSESSDEVTTAEARPTEQPNGGQPIQVRSNLLRMSEASEPTAAATPPPAQIQQDDANVAAPTINGDAPVADMPAVENPEAREGYDLQTFWGVEGEDWVAGLEAAAEYDLEDEWGEAADNADK